MSNPRAFVLVLLLAWLPAGAAHAAPAGARAAGDDAWCGTGKARLEVSAARHLLFQRRLERQRLAAVPTKATQVYRAGQVAVFRDDGRLVAGPETFDLAHQGVELVPGPGGYRTRRSARPLFATVGERIAIGETDSVAVDLSGWKFPFYGETYSRVYVNADGNLTFGSPSARAPGYYDFGLGPFLDGPPRIAAFYADLDPSQTSGEDGVFVMRFANRLRVTWLRVPTWATGERGTFQVTLFASGRIQMLYGDVEARVAVVGISPGGGDPRLELLDLDVDPPYPAVPGAIAESFSFQHEYDELGLVRMFYDHFRDVYDFIIVYLDFPHQLLGGGANAYYYSFQNTDRGIARRVFDDSDLAGSDGKLQYVVHMGMTDLYPDDPDQVFRHIHTPMSILAHEVGHRWLATVRFRDRNGAASDELRDAYIISHWSFHHDTQGSVMLGNYIRDNGDGTFLTLDGPRHYSDLDLYLMGLLPPEQVRPFFYVDNVGSPPSYAKPQAGITMIGDRVNVTVEQVIAVEGPRLPSSAESQKHFNTAFVLLTADGQPPRRESLAKVQRIRRRWIRYFPEITRGQATVATAIHLQ